MRMEDHDRRISEGQTAVTDWDLSKLEQKLLEHQDVIEFPGKGSKSIPVIIPEAAKTGMEFISSHTVRQAVGIKMDNRYLFANTEETGVVIDVRDALVHSCRMAGLRYPARITQTTCRKYMATVAQVSDMKSVQMEWVMQQMRHSLDDHKIDVHLASNDTQRQTDIVKIILLQDRNTLAKLSNQMLENIQLKDLVQFDDGQGDDEPRMSAEPQIENENTTVATDVTVTNTHHHMTTNRKKYTVQRQHIWGMAEEDEIRTIFHKCFESKTRPTPKQCVKAIKISKKKGGLIAKRKRDVLKKKLFRMID